MYFRYILFHASCIVKQADGKHVWKNVMIGPFSYRIRIIYLHPTVHVCLSLSRIASWHAATLTYLGKEGKAQPCIISMSDKNVDEKIPLIVEATGAIADQAARALDENGGNVESAVAQLESYKKEVMTKYKTGSIPEELKAAVELVISLDKAKQQQNTQGSHFGTAGACRQ